MGGEPFREFVSQRLPGLDLEAFERMKPGPVIDIHFNRDRAVPVGSQLQSLLIVSSH